MRTFGSRLRLNDMPGFMRALAPCAIACLAGAAHADPDAQRRLNEAVDALGVAQSIEFTSTMSSKMSFPGLGAIEQSGSSVVRMKRDVNAGNRWRARVEGKSQINAPGQSQETVFTIVDHNAHVEWKDETKQAVIERFKRRAQQDQHVMAAANTWANDMMAFDPFKVDLQAPTMRIEGTTTIDGVACDIVFVDEGENKQKRRWYLATTDKLPRKLERLMPDLSDQTKVNVTDTFEMSGLKVNPTIDEAMFSIPTPAGWTEERLPKPKPVEQGGNNDGDSGDPGMSSPDAGLNVFPAIPFEVTDLAGTQHTLASIQGKTTVLYFFASWNPTAADATKAMQAILAQFKDKPVQVLGMAVRERDEAKLKDFLAKNGATFPTVFSKEDRIFRQYRGQNYPHFAVVDPNGIVQLTTSGFRPEETQKQITEIIQNILDGKVKSERPTTTLRPMPGMTPPGGGSDAGGSDAGGGRDDGGGR